MKLSHSANVFGAVALIILLSFISLSSGAQAIPQAGKNNTQDQQLIQLYQQARKSGMSDADINSMLQQRGMSANDIGNFRKRMQGSSGNKPDSMPAVVRDTVWLKEAPEPPKKLNFYGYDFFNTPNRSFAPNVQMATPAGYVLGPGDELLIAVTGLNENDLSAKVTPEGNVKLPYAGVIAVSGLTIEQAQQRIRSKLLPAYPALASGKTQLLVTLGQLKTIHVSIVGEAERQGTYTVSSAAGFFNVLYLSGGPSANGSLRRIELIRNNKPVATVDFYNFLQKGIFENNLRLEDQDIIRFPVYQKRITISGEIKRPAVYELLDKETLGDALTMAGGFADNAYRERLSIIENGTQEKRARSVAATDFNYFLPRNADSVFIDRIAGRFENRIILSGAVKHPGTYELTEGMTLQQLLQQANGLLETAFLNRGYIKRRKPEGEREMFSFNPEMVLNGRQAPIALVKEDSVYIFDKDDITASPSVAIGGAVRSPGTFTYRQGMRLEDLVIMAGGFTISAANQRIEINRLEKNTSDTLANQLIHLVTLQVDSALTSNDSRYVLQPMDYIFVPQLLNYRVLGNIKVTGEVLYPGEYTLEKRNEAVQDIIERAGGVSPFGAFKNLQVYRNHLRVGTDIFSSPDNHEPFLLQPGDSLYVPRNESFVEVDGQVFNQQIVSYSSSHFMDYISAAGGVTDNGKLKKAYIQYSNGINRKIKHFLFFRRYPKVLPGSKIVVPEKSLYPNGLFTATSIAAYTSIFTALIALISVLKN
ncbi:SLBB domain-containing protein [Deminuibacter soli]|nr:SLBB domain-containing protein [Deminuibacter soli]